MDAPVKESPSKIRSGRVSRAVWLSLGFAAGVITACGALVGWSGDGISGQRTPQFQLIAEAWNTIQRSYVHRDTLTPDQLTHGAIRGMVDALGDTGHSRFLTPEMRRVEREVTQGSLEGIGAEVQKKQNQIVIVAPLDNSPAQRAGLRPGDVILKVNGQPVSGLALEQVVSQIVGPADTPVDVTILSPATGQTRDVHLIRARVTLHSVTWHQLPGTSVAHVRLAMFSKGVSADLRRTLKAIEREGLTGAILDLRNNPGGLFTEAIETTSQFLGSGNAVLERDASGKIEPVRVRSGGVALHLPVVVLINDGTASAAEIVAGALADAHRATLVGEKTFGTGTILQPFQLTDGSALLLATKEWLTPAGRLIWHQGIPPDIVVTLPLDATLLRPAAERDMTAAALRASNDAQLLRGLKVLEEGQTPEQKAGRAKGLVDSSRRTAGTSQRSRGRATLL